MVAQRTACVTPSAARLTDSLRDIGYDFSSAIADLVDNSITARATQVDIFIEFEGEDSRVFIADNGEGMTTNGLTEAMRFGSRRSYGRGDLGRYGLGLKTASLSQGRAFTVVTRRATGRQVIQTRQLDLDLVAEFDDWLIIDPERTSTIQRARNLLQDGQGTVVIWEKLDRVVPAKNATGGWARRRFETLAEKTAEHLAMVFHRFLAGESGTETVAITVNGSKILPWDPFARNEKATLELSEEVFEIQHGEAAGIVRLRRFVLPGRDQFSSHNAFERLSGPLKWNRQQGLYTYRAHRLIQWGGWAGVRGIDEHTKLARASVDFDTDLDAAFNINVAKMRVALPAQLRQMIERPINEMCATADDRYRKSSNSKPPVEGRGGGGDITASAELGLALKAAAIQADEYAAFKKIAKILRKDDPNIATALGI
ncbi:ATP-binding protein [Mycolicibacterium tusciae]|uniref:ATP-binding protein n=1 Tax=Mycolicibacterium tusciae TaxID=75922 RepID=A0A1X0JUQ6_9MYCO|nr:ATP-binding protein [Mycolicibacterium tusciae]ORB66669.1 ATP-binding protein [Mycolicibacterium tusciae]